MYHFNYQIDWVPIIWVIGLSFIGLYQVFQKSQFSLSFSCIIKFLPTVLIISSLLIYSAFKLSVIREKIENEEIYTIEGVVSEIYVHNAKDVFYINFKDQRFEIYDNETYCFSGNNVVSKGDYIRLEYIDINRWAGFITPPCILKLVKKSK